jgi:hypothetical protein
MLRAMHPRKRERVGDVGDLASTISSNRSMP